jgi:putative phage-type endonuclease
MIKIHDQVIQGTEEWHALRCGLLTASEVKLIITPKQLKASNNDKTRAHQYELAAQRISGYVEPQYVSDGMLRGEEDEILARVLYSQKYSPVTEVGFVTNDDYGFTIGCSPDGLVGEDGMIEIKSRVQKYQVETIVTNEVDEDYMLQIQTGLIVTGRKWCDFISYCGGFPMFVKRVFPNPEFFAAIILAGKAFDDKINETIATYKTNIVGLHPTERTVQEEMVI